MILTADWHLTDSPEEVYRWDVFRAVADYCKKTGDYDVVILGDLTDRKDRHSSGLVNSLISHLRNLVVAGCQIRIIMGNHDRPLSGVPFWNFLSALDGVAFYTSPIRYQNYLYLPYTPDPRSDWAGLFHGEEHLVCFVHQPVAGARLANGTLLQDQPPLPIPNGQTIWAGDIHPPQAIGPVTYVGAPHPIKFGDVYPTRLLRIDGKGRQIGHVTLVPTRRDILEIHDIDELAETGWRNADQVKVRMHIPGADLDLWPAARHDIEVWAKKHKLVLVSCEAIVDLGGVKAASAASTLNLEPDAVLAEFAKEENLPKPTLEWGLQVMREELGN